MLVPEFLFGTTKEVRQRLRKIITQIRKGKTLPEIIDSFDAIDIQDRPDSLLVLASLWRGVGGEHFHLYQLGKAIAWDSRNEWSDVNAFRDDSIEYLASTTWGAIAINSPQQYYWIQDYPLSKGVPKRKAFIAVLGSVTRYWDEFEKLGDRFSIGAGVRCGLQHCKPLASHVLAVCLQANQADHHQISDHDLADQHLVSKTVEHLSLDDGYWAKVCEYLKRVHAGPQAGDATQQEPS